MFYWEILSQMHFLKMYELFFPVCLTFILGYWLNVWVPCSSFTFYSYLWDMSIVLPTVSLNTVWLDSPWHLFPFYFSIYFYTSCWPAAWRRCIWVLLFFLINFFYWRIITLQNFAVFCQTSTWISHRYTYIPSLLKLPPTSLPILPL